MKLFLRSWTWSKRHIWDVRLPQRTDFISWDLDVKDSSTDHVWPRWCAKVHARSGVLGVGVPPTTGFLTHAGKFGAVLGKGPPQQAAAGHSVSFLLRDPGGEAQAAGKAVEQEKGTSAVSQKPSSCEPCGGVA